MSLDLIVCSLFLCKSCIYDCELQLYRKNHDHDYIGQYGDDYSMILDKNYFMIFK